MVSDPLAADRAVARADERHVESEVKEAKAKRRRTWYYEVVLILVGYYAYSQARNLVTAHEGEAVHRANQVVRLERTLHIYHERSINQFVAGQHWLAYLSNYYYAVFHFLVTIVVGVWIYRRHPEWARQLRTAWYCMNIVALLGFAFLPLAPPRLLKGAGYIDTVVQFHTWGSWGDKGVAAESNQYAAMPSMHIGWSLWVAIVVVLLARHTWVRVIGALYPVVTLFVIVGTANHYYLDAVGGIVACLGGIMVARLLTRRQILPPLHRPHALSAYR